MSVSAILSRKARAGGVGLPRHVPAVGRNYLARLAAKFGWTRGAEIGVWKGAFSALLLADNPQLHMLCVDPWQSYPAWLDTKNSLPAEEATAFMESARREAVARLTPLNATIVRKFSTDAATEIPDQSLDFVYIDGNHVYDAVTADLDAWTPKVKPGGLVAGHDYRRFENKPTIHVVDAVNDFTTTRGIDPWFVLSADRTPSFAWEVA